MAIYATAGSKLFIGQVLAAQTADFEEADFDSMSWIEVGWLNNLGAFGDEASEITFDVIGQGRTQKLKGTRNAGNIEAICGADYDDDGQVAVVAAERTSDDYAWRVQFDDAPEGGTPSERYFIGKVMSAREQLDEANNVIRLTFTIGVNSNIVRVDAAEA